ncbi:receptor-like protein kinase [Gossypium australe]|uniref:Receptor-like protein kinase n=1 Tax=Gossypium australe TaxID=47621 RepID=A0A5B6WPZ4_9ROSI|nr:receptor-like protein kinase [Gossypium australe]
MSPCFIGPYEIIERIGPVAYRLALPPELDKIHNVFHPDMTYSEEQIKILARETKELRNKKVALVKVLWQKHGIEEATWESKDTMRKQFPNLFTSKIFEDKNP